jgi:hypothetical protein
MTATTVELNPGLGGAKSLHEGSIPKIDGETPPASAVVQAIKLMGKSASAWPGYSGAPDVGLNSVQVDEYGATITRGSVVTDEGTFRCNFANSSLAVGLGAVTVAGNVVTGTGFLSADVHYKDYFKLSGDADTAWVQISTINSDTEIELVSSYVGGASGTGQRSLMLPMIGSGGGVSVASGQCTITSGTTINAVSGVKRFTDYAPLVFRARCSVSQRIVNQEVHIGLEEDAAVPRWFARFLADGTTNTTIKCETGRNPTGAPSASEIETSTVTLPFGLTTATALDYRVELLTEAVRFCVNGVRVAEHVRVLPHQHDEMTSHVEIRNGASAPASTTSVVLDYVTGKNHNKLEVGVMSDTEQIIAVAQPLVPFAYSQAGVIAINTDLIVLDCRQLRSLSIQCNSMGTTGVVTVQWSNEPTFAQPITATLLTEAGAIGTTFNAAGLRYANVLAAYCRLRLTTATTAGTTTLNVWGSQNPIPLLVGTQPVSGTVTANQGTMVALPAGTNNIGYVGRQVPLLVADVASAALTTTTTTAAFTPAFGSSYSVNVPVTAVTGTNPTLDVVIEESDDTGTNWAPVYAFPRITATGIYRSPLLPNLGNRVRYVQTVTGTTPSFTRAVNRLQRSDSVLPLRQIIDRTVSLTTLNSATPTLNSQGTRNVQLVVNVGAITTTAPALQLEASDDNGGSWYAVGSPLTAVASSTVQVLVNNVQAGALRARVSTAGSGVTAGYVLLKAF